jgi:hypothetical protein
VRVLQEIMSEDIGNILQGWKFNPDDDLVVRIIRGDDNRAKVQMRIDMGIMQMELDGHPAGERPEGEESWLAHYERLRDEAGVGGDDDSFTLTEADCRKLNREGVRYYYRYLSLMKLEDYPRVIRDTGRNLRLFAFVKQYAEREVDRWALDQYRPYVIMINTRARASLALRDDPVKGVAESVEIFDRGIGGIVAFYNEYNIAEEIQNSTELSILNALRKEFLRVTPPSLEELLDRAIREERYEDAASLRDKLKGEKR